MICFFISFSHQFFFCFSFTENLFFSLLLAQSFNFMILISWWNNYSVKNSNHSELPIRNAADFFSFFFIFQLFVASPRVDWPNQTQKKKENANGTRWWWERWKNDNDDDLNEDTQIRIKLSFVYCVPLCKIQFTHFRAGCCSKRRDTTSKTRQSSHLITFRVNGWWRRFRERVEKGKTQQPIQRVDCLGWIFACEMEIFEIFVKSTATAQRWKN